MQYEIVCNMKGSRKITVLESHLETIEKYSLLSELLDSHGIVDESTLDKLRLNLRSLLDGTNGDPDLISLAHDIVFHPNMKALALHQLILLFIDWQKEKLDTKQ